MVTTRIECFVLLRLGWKVPAEDLCDKIRERFPMLESVTGVSAQADSGMPDKITIDGATVSLSVVNAPYPPESLLAPVRLIEHVDPEGLASAQLAYVMLSAEAPEGSAEMAEAYSALVTMVASVVASDAPSLACFWSESWRLVSPADMINAAERIVNGDFPRDLWISFAEVKGSRAGAPGNRGLLSFGLRVFTGREVEVAPAPLPLATLEDLARDIAHRLIDEPTPIDFDAVSHPGIDEPVVLRLAETFLRPRQPALVAVPATSVYAADTLEPRGAQKRGGFMGRLFGN